MKNKLTFKKSLKISKISKLAKKSKYRKVNIELNMKIRLF